MSFLFDLLSYVTTTLIQFLPILLLGAGLASCLQVYMDSQRLQELLRKHSAISIPATVVFGALTPFCACGTMAVLLAMLAGTMPWAPIMAFLTSSPLMGPTNFVLLYGIVGSSFAITVLFASLLTGLTAGYATYLIDRKTTFLQNQLRFQQTHQNFGSKSTPPSNIGIAQGHLSMQYEAKKPLSSHTIPLLKIETQTEKTSYPLSCANDPQLCGCEITFSSQDTVLQNDACSSSCSDSMATNRKNGKFMDFLKGLFEIGIIRILPLFVSLTAIGFLVSRLVPPEIFTVWLGSRSLIGVPMASLVGLPLYVSGESAAPLIRSFLESGASPGTMLAFMIAGPGTSAAVIAGVSAIMKKRAIVLYVGYILGAALLFGYGYDVFLLMMK